MATLTHIAGDRILIVAGLVVAAASGLGAGLAAWTGFAAVGDVISVVSRWGRGPWARLRELQDPLSLHRKKDQDEAGRNLPVVSMTLVGAGGVLALVARDPVLSPWVLFLCGVLAWWWRGYSRRRERRSEAMPQVLRLLQLLDNYLRDSITGALVKAADKMEEGSVRKAVENATQAHFMGTSWRAAIREHLTGNQMLTRLALLLAVAPRMDGQEVRDAIQAQIRGISIQESLQAEAGAELVLLKLTVRFLAVANAVAVVATLVVPAWHGFFTSTLSRRGTFVAASLMSSAAYVYFSEEIELLKEEL
jgi:hypothetical protein